MKVERKADKKGGGGRGKRAPHTHTHEGHDSSLNVFRQEWDCRRSSQGQGHHPSFIPLQAHSHSNVLVKGAGEDDSLVDAVGLEELQCVVQQRHVAQREQRPGPRHRQRRKAEGGGRVRGKVQGWRGCVWEVVVLVEERA